MRDKVTEQKTGQQMGRQMRKGRVWECYRLCAFGNVTLNCCISMLNSKAA